ncbi:MAG: hypothetical protein O3B24_01705 [Verrucomicrobia bacterium]|nr:hypothetical protein [Verrucomicrobiota bacterium]
MNRNPQPAPLPTFSAFWPLCLLGASLFIFLGWQLTESIRQNQQLAIATKQQEALAGRAAQTESQLQSIMMDLLSLASTDDEAKAIVTKYGIRFNPPAATEPTAAAPVAAPSPEEPLSPSVEPTAVTPPEAPGAE